VLLVGHDLAALHVLAEVERGLGHRPKHNPSALRI
jgi:hypothetical protein